MRKGCVLFFSFAGAVFFAQYLLPQGLWLWVGLGILPLAGLGIWRKWRLVTLVSLGLCAALVWTAGYRLTRVKPWEELTGRRSEVTFTLCQTPEPVEDYAARAEVTLRGEGKMPIQALFYGDLELLDRALGDEITVVCDIARADRLYGEETAVYTSKGIFLRLTARGEMTVSTPAKTPLRLLPAKWGERLSAGIRAVFPEDVAPFLAAMTAGDRRGISEELTGQLSRAGIAHLTAISGMHICFLVGFLCLFAGSDPRRRAAVCIPAIVLFSLAVGAGASVLRAACLYIILLLAPLLGRESDRWTSLSFALALLLLWDPYSAKNIGLQMSFAAAAGLILIAEPLRQRWREKLPGGESRIARLGRWILAGLGNTLAGTLGALAFTLPLSMLYFGSISLIQPLTNLLVLPVSSLLFALTLLLGLMGMVLPGPAGALGGAVAYPARYVLAVVKLAAKVPLGAVTTGEIYYPIFILGLYALGLIWALGRGKRRWAVFLLCGGVLFGGAWGFTSSTFHVGDLTATVLDVGQGQSVVLSSGGETALVDCGGNTLTDPGDIAGDYLLDRGLGTLDYLVLTHYHSDHTNGLEALFRRVKVKRLVLPQMEHDEDTQIWLLNRAEEMGAEVLWITENTDLPLGEATLRLYAPLGDGGANEEGLALLAMAGEFEILLTGDMNTAVEEMLIQYGDLPSHVEVLVAGHHGSRYATGEALLSAIRPETAIISVGRNSYGHPAEETLERLETWNTAVYRTDSRGNVTVTARAS